MLADLVSVMPCEESASVSTESRRTRDRPIDGGVRQGLGQL